MDYELTAVVGFESVLSASSARFLELRCAPLEHGLGLIPVTREFLLELERDKKMSLNKRVPDFGNGLQPRNLTPPLVAFLQDLSGFTPAAFCQASYEAGSGEQIAILWQASKIIVGPLGTTWGKFGNPHNKVRMEEMAINTVLRRMGVRPVKGKDEFDLVGLGRKRTTEAWC